MIDPGGTELPPPAANRIRFLETSSAPPTDRTDPRPAASAESTRSPLRGAPAAPASPEIAPGTAATNLVPTRSVEEPTTPPPQAVPAPPARDFQPGVEIRVPSGAKARVEANIAVIDLLARLDREQRHPTPEEQSVLAAWSGWGAVPQIFDRRVDTFASQRQYLQTLLSPQQYRAAESSILNAHYTDPAVAAAMWNALQEAGFSGGRVLEPGCGSGTFIGLAPPQAGMVGVEQDPITAAVAAHLYPSAQIRAEGFQDTRVPNGSFVATIGNVPFGDFAVADPAHNPQGHSLHNHFIIKSLNLTAPGGYVVVLTSSFTMDSVKDSHRRAMAERADLIGAVRLPARAFKRVAGTDVVTDVLVLRRRGPDERPPLDSDTWIRTMPMEVDNDAGERVELTLNSYFHEHPENILGELHAGHGMYNDKTMTVLGDPEAVATDVQGRLSAIIAAARARHQGLTATAATVTDVGESSFDPGLLTKSAAGELTPLDTLRHHSATNRIERWTGSQWVEQNVPRSRVGEYRELIALRDAATAVIRSQRLGQPAEEREKLRGHLNRIYDTYVAAHGPVNRFIWEPPRYPSAATIDKEVAKQEEAWRKAEGGSGGAYRGEVPQALYEQWYEKASQPRAGFKRTPHLNGGMRNDPHWVDVASLEDFDDDTQQVRKAPIFSVDLLGPPAVIEHADNAADALAICLEQHGRVDIDYIAGLLSIDADTATEQLAGLVYPSLDDPEDLVSAVHALSGNVRVKLARARAAAQDDSRYLDYAEALRRVQPTDKTASEINVRPGAPWIEPRYVGQFVEQVFGGAAVEVAHIAGEWNIKASNRGTVAMTENWGTPDRDAVALLEAVCNSRRITVERPQEDIDRTGGDRIDRTATLAAQAKAERITERFKTWVFEEEQRRDTLVAEFNRRFNSLRAPQHRGDTLRLPGKSDRFQPHPYQRDAVARIIAEPTVLLDHVVGAGKTGSMFMGAMELRRLGIARQPWLIVPNHLIEQVGREAKWWYPAAKVLMAPGKTDPDARRRLAAQSAATDWDMVIVPQSLFTGIGVSKEVQETFIGDYLSELENALYDAPEGLSKKLIQKQIERANTRMQRQTDQTRKDTGLTFEETGCDYLFIDEAHMYKNRARTSHIHELALSAPSKRADDLAMKLMVLRRRRRDEARAAGRPVDASVERVATFATGTPIANSIGEMWVMQTYMRPDLLEAAGVADINAWAATFTTTVNTVEVNATGTSLRPVTRIGKFCNLSELLAISSVFTDVVTRDDVPMALPKLRDGQRRIISITPSQEVKDFIADLGWRASNLSTDRLDLDNVLKISTDGRNVSLDPRMAHLDAPAESRAARVAEEVMRIHRHTADNVYLDETGAAMPRRGGLQIVFCDRGTPKGDGHFNMYDAIRGELLERGMPADAIRFIHDYDKPADKLRLFKECGNGKVSVLLGSTEKMGTGTNVQARATALHHVDVPWRPADLQQREGRIIRQGNQNETIEILNYVTEGSYDTVMWQKVEAKALFIEQVKRKDITSEEVEDVGGEITAAAAETKAIATGDPRYIRQVQLQDEVQKLDALERAHHEGVRRREHEVKRMASDIASTRRDLDTLAPVAQEAATRTDDPAQVDIDGRRYTGRKEAAEPFAAACRAAFTALKNRPRWEQRPIAALNGIPVLGRRDTVNGKLVLSLEVPSAETTVAQDDLYATIPTMSLDGAEPTSSAKSRGLLQRVENVYKDLPNHHTRLLRHLDILDSEFTSLTNNGHEDFEHRESLADKREELTALTSALRLESQSEAAQAAAQAAQERLRAAGRQPGWSLHLNPTPALCADAGYPDADSYRFAYRMAEGTRAAEYHNAHHRDADQDTDNGHERERDR